MAGMRETKIRFGEEAWRLIQEEAARDGVSGSQFVREAATAWAIYLRAGRTSDPQARIRDIIEALRR
jgi:hypothetical protein